MQVEHQGEASEVVVVVGSLEVDEDVEVVEVVVEGTEVATTTIMVEVFT